MALAARDGAGMHGVAFRASLVSFNVASADCTPASCRIADADVARALHSALDAGVRVFNISLSTALAGAETLGAIGRAADAGVVVVIAAGNQGLRNPVRSALQVADAGRGVVIIAGAHDATAQSSEPPEGDANMLLFAPAFESSACLPKLTLAFGTIQSTGYRPKQFISRLFDYSGQAALMQMAMPLRSEFDL